MKALFVSDVLISFGNDYVILFKKGASFQVKGQDASQYSEFGKSFFSVPSLQPHLEFMEEEESSRLKFLMFD